MHFSTTKKREINQLLQENHYIGSQCAEPTYIFCWRNDGGLFGDMGDIVAAALFAPSVSMNWGSKTIELVRLVKDSSVTPPLTQFVSKCLKFIERDKRFTLVVSYADPSAGHHGGVYQAGNWIYVGKSSPAVFWVHTSTKKRLSRRGMERLIAKACSPELREAIERQWVKVNAPPKHAYVYPLTKSEKLKWAGKSIPYPKPLSQSC